MQKILSLYLKIIIVVFALAGAICLLCLQFGFLGPKLLSKIELVDNLPAGETVTIVVGQRGYFSELIPVDPSRTYRLSGFFRTSSDKAGAAAASRVYFGIRLYDKKLQALTSGPGAYKYPASNGILLTGLEGWVRLHGEVNGESEAGENSFRPGTAWIRVVVVPSYGTSDVTTEFAGIEFSERVQLAMPAYDAGN